MLPKFIIDIPKYVFNILCIGCSRGEHVTRYFMYKHFAENFRENRSPDERVLSISGSGYLCQILGYEDSAIRNTSYPEYNMLDLPFEDEEFDAVISDQVLEHVEGNPQDAIDETLRILKPGGLLVHATCFINPVHGAPSDFWRFTPEALDYLVNKKATVVEAAGWGNVFIWGFFALGLRYEKIPNCKYHPFNWLATFNQARLPVTTWVVARKNKS